MTNSEDEVDNKALDKAFGIALAEELRGLRAISGLTQEEMAEKLNVHRNTIVNIEKNAENAKAKYIRRYRSLALGKADEGIADELGTPFRNLLKKRFNHFFSR